MTAEVEERVVQKMAEGDDDQDAAQRDERVARPQTKHDERAGHEFDERNGDAGSPERPDGQEGVGERQEIFTRVFEWPELKYFHDAGHEEDKAENEATEEQCPCAIRFVIHRSRRFSQIEDQSGKQELRKKFRPESVFIRVIRG